jgi:uncharacterized lipoprotein YajG
MRLVLLLALLLLLDACQTPSRFQAVSSLSAITSSANSVRQQIIWLLGQQSTFCRLQPGEVRVVRVIYEGVRGRWA